MKNLEKKYGHKKASLVLHTDPVDQEGPNLFAISERFGIKDSVIFSTERVDFPHMNALHNIADCGINISYAEGFGLATLESMQTGTPIIALKTGGLTRQVVDHRDGSENGIALDVELKSLVGSQQVPYIYEDYCTPESVGDAFMKMYEMGNEQRREIGLKAKSYVENEFSYQKSIDQWHETLKNLIENWDKNYQSYKTTTI